MIKEIFLEEKCISLSFLCDIPNEILLLKMNFDISIGNWLAKWNIKYTWIP